MGGQGHADWERQQRAFEREQEKLRRAEERDQAAAEKERKRQYLASRQAETNKKNRQIEARVTSLTSMLQDGLGRSARIDLLAMRRTVGTPPLDLGQLANPIRKPRWEEYEPRTPGAISRAFGGSSRYERRLAAARQAFEIDSQESDRHETVRQQKVVEARQEHARKAEEQAGRIRMHNIALEVRAAGLHNRQQEHVEGYLKDVLVKTPVPGRSKRRTELTFDPRQELVIAQVELPPLSVVPEVSSYRYVSTKDEQRPTARNRRNAGDLYRQVVSQAALLYVRDLFNADDMITRVCFNGHVDSINRATGEADYPCLISLDVERSSFPADSNLRRVDPVLCVRGLKAIVSNHPHDLEEIQPILDFDLSKYRFVEGLDAVSSLDARPDLLQMSPSNFEHLVRQIFEAQGAEGWTTEQSNDDGVDAVILNRSPLVGGLSIVQAKRYSRVVGVSHIRELAGAMEEKRAGWGILITTSWFASGCERKAREHGRMELIDGERLKYLVKNNLGKDVLVGTPDRPRQRREDSAT